MRIAVIASRLHTGGGRVVGQRIVDSICRLLPDHEVLIVCPTDAGYEVHQSDKITVLFCPRQSILRQVAWDLLALRKALKVFHPDWVWAIGNYPVNGRWPQSLLVHDPHLMFDSSWFRGETVTNKLKKGIGKLLLRRRIGKVTRFYCQTNAIRDRFANCFNISHDQIGLCPPGIDPPVPGHMSTGLADQLNPIIRRAKLLLFYPARCYGHKNHRAILEAYKNHSEQVRDTVCIWTIAAGQHPVAKQLLDEIRVCNLGHQIINVGPLSAQEVSACFAVSGGMIMPTKLETFGIPFVEAMQHGIPIITSDYDFVRSVCDDAAAYLSNPDDPKELANLIKRFRDDENLRRSLVLKGKTQVAEMKSWDQVVADVLSTEGLPLGPETVSS